MVTSKIGVKNNGSMISHTVGSDKEHDALATE